MNKDPFRRRTAVYLAFLALASLSLLAVLFHMQIIDTKYSGLATQNVVKKRRVYPPRGLIYDRNEELLVYNEPIFDLYVTPSQAEESDSAMLIDLLGITPELYRENMAKARRYSPYKPSVFYRQISEKEYASFQEYLYLFPGFQAEPRTVRHYTIQGAAHVLGDVGEVNLEDLARDPSYKQGDYIGKSGIEKVYEDLLKGKVGVEHVLTDVHNRIVGRLDNGAKDTLPIRGKNLGLTIDADLQLYGERLMQNKKGSIVAIEPATGEILALVSSPGYDPNLLYGRKRGENYKKLAADSLSPLFNRAVMATYPPGSTFKPLVALIALAEGGIVEDTRYVCNGLYYIPGYTLHCSHGHAPSRNVQDAIRHSCNPYFWEAFRKTIDHSSFANVAEGYAKWYAYTRQFGLDQKLGLDLPSEAKGNVPSPDYYNNLYGKGAWGSSTILSLGIGQGEITVTPLQLAQLYVILANRGFAYPPHLLATIEDTTVNNYNKTYYQIDKEHFEAVAEGLLQVVENGTGRRSRIPGTTLCGKTGTAQNPHGEDHSLFASFAPFENPQIVVAAVVENAGGGSRYAAPIASLLTEYYLHDSISNSRAYFEKTILDANLLDVKQDAQ